MNSWLIITVMSILQGLTEFLPISSSGHLALLSRLFGLPQETGSSLSIVLHAGSLLAIVIFYFKTLIGFFRKEQFHLLLMVIAGSVPAGIVGIAMKKSGLIDLLFGDMLSLAMGFLITASLLRLTGKEKLRSSRNTELNDITLPQALTVGAVQAVAIIPGISRSGSTIAAGILSGIKFEAAAAFSFLLALPAIFGASLLEFVELAKDGFDLAGFTVVQLAAAFLISAAVSIASLTLLIGIIRRQKLSWFSWYLFLIGASIIVWQIIANAEGN